jgi:hypothetical protein
MIKVRKDARDDIEGIIAVVFAISTAYYADKRTISRIICGSI